ncbi:MAG: tetraacyldisaccharide 4'-kinase, partial [Acinetobacter sp.]|nr:tetraacyldisaccharide 4'-kinase [Acinetobacter sp.]
MSIAQHLQHAWQQQATWLKCLRPLSCLYLWAFKFNRALYQRGLKKSYRPPVPVLVVGNITVGGSGKTPLLIALVRYLQQHQVRVGVISRGYGGKGPFPALVHLSSTPEQVGDEPCLIVQSTQVPMAVGANRQQSIELLLQHHQLDLILSDDGLQHWALQRDIEWIVLDGQRGLGNERVLPEGFLREPKQRLQNATVIEHHHQASRALNMHLAVGQPYLLFPQLHHATFNTQQNFHAVVGIGYPERFYRTLN